MVISLAKQARRVTLAAAVLGVVGLADGAGSAFASTNCARSGQTVTCTDATPGDVGGVTLPSGVVSFQAVAVGGKGGGAFGGAGAKVSAQIARGGSTVILAVGGNGGSGSGGYSNVSAGGAGCYGGGGASAVTTASSATFLLVAGGGGGDGCPGNAPGGYAFPETAGGAAGAPGATATGSPANGAGGENPTPTAPGLGGAGGIANSGIANGSPGSTGYPAGGAGGAGSSAGGSTGGEGGGGGGGWTNVSVPLAGPGGGGGGGAVYCPGGCFEFDAGSGGGGGGGASLIPSGATFALDTSGTPQVTISYNIIAFTSGNPPAGSVGASYQYTYKAIGDRGIIYTVSAGTLPPGLKLGLGGTLQGTPNLAGTYTYTVRATGLTAYATRTDTITIG